MIFSGSQMTMFKTVGQEIYRILRLKKIPKDEIRPKVEEILNRFKISNLKNKFRWMIKKDEMKLIGLAISYAKDTPIILVDDIDLSMVYYLNELSKHKLVIATTSDENLALEHATKLIMLENGQISKNIDHDPSIYIRKEEGFIKTNLEKKRCKSKFFNFAILISSLLILMLSLFTLSTYSTLFIKLNTISQFDIAINQISDQEIYLAPVAKYQERAFTYGWSFIVQAGTFDYSHDVHPSYRELLVDKTNNLLDIYESYFFNKNLQDFFPITLDIPKIFQSNNFKSFHFTEVIVVDDFSNFRQPLLYGELPSLSNDILIYDYMAEQIIGSVNLNMTQINELIGFEFVDRDTQLSLVVSGIMKSQYQDFYHIQQASYTDNIVELSYIQELQSIVSKPELLSLITLEKKYENRLSNAFYRNTNSW
jgi:energy-coupling factor transporter ATP-binding protein EcfA2